MKRINLNLTLLLLVISSAAYGQHTSTISDKFFHFLNSYQKDSLHQLIADDFQLTRTYTSFAHDKFTFLENYLPMSKAFNGKYQILKIFEDQEPQQYLVEDHSDYLKYLNVDYPTWNFFITTENNKIKQVTIDTTETYPMYLIELKKADEKFTTWLKVNHPEDTKEALFYEEGKLSDRLKEYAKKEN